jgi:hypothetical protein
LTAPEWQRAQMAALGAYGGMEMFELMNKRNCMLVRGIRFTTACDTFHEM